LAPGSAKATSPFGIIIKRALSIHEYQAMKLLQKYNVPTPAGDVATTPEEAQNLANHYLADNRNASLVVKAQVLAGGRGKGTFTNGFKGGVHKANS